MAMIDSDQDLPSEVISPSAKEISQSQSLPTEDSAGHAEFQGQPADMLEERLKRKIEAVGELLADKEGLIQVYVTKRVPKPFYIHWKREANEVFMLLVRLKKRREGRRNDTNQKRVG